MAGRFRELRRQALDLVFPPACLHCQARVDRQGTLCAACWQGLHFLTPPGCARCGFPFAYELGPEALCAACTSRPPVYERARAALAYDDSSRALVTRLKYGDRLEGAGIFAGWMGRAGAELLREADAILPVPLHWRRLLARRFNQAALLAEGLSALSGVPHRPELLRRLRHTAPQVGLSQTGRRRNVAHAFGLDPKAETQLKGAAVLLVDDVHTTGATVEACAKVLKRGGARRVDVLTLARVVAERALPI